MSTDERWLPIAGFDGYEVSDLARVRSWRPRCPSSPVPTEPRILKLRHHSFGYPMIGLCRPGMGTRDRKLCRVHHLVLDAFVGPRPPGTECRHLDGNPRDSRLSNVAWGTKSENWNDKRLHGTDTTGERNGLHRSRGKAIAHGADSHRAKLSEAEAQRAIALLAEGATDSEVAVAVMASRACITDVRAGRTWAHLPRPWTDGPDTRSINGASSAQIAAVEWMVEFGIAKHVAARAVGASPRMALSADRARYRNAKASHQGRTIAACERLRPAVLPAGTAALCDLTGRLPRECWDMMHGDSLRKR